MEPFNWKLVIRRNIIMLKISGLWPAGDDTYQLNFYTFYTLFILIVFVYGHNFFQAINIFFILDDLEAVVATIFISLTETLSILKSYYLIRNMKILKELMVTLRTDEMFQPLNDRQKEILEPAINLWKIVYNTFSSMTLVALAFWLSFPILDKSLKDHRLPFLAWYPWDSKVTPLYQLSYLHQIASSGFICLYNLNIDTLIAALNMCIGAQCDILCDNLRHIHKFPDVSQRLIYCIKHHKAILRFSENSNIFFNWIVLMQFFVSAISIGLTMFQLTVVAAFSSEFYSCICYGNAVVVQIFMYCWFGNEVEIKSSRIPYAVFESNWTQASLEVKKNLIIFTLRSQNPIKISALNLFYLTLDTFMTILRTAYSYFALLHQIQE